MFPRARHRRAHLTRLLALWLLLLSAIWQPVLASVGDIHELSHGGAAHAVAEGDHAHEDDRLDSGDQEEAGNLLHALMHAGHCCGHAVAMPVSVPTNAVIIEHTAAPAWHPISATVAPTSHPFRPPIG